MTAYQSADGANWVVVGTIAWNVAVTLFALSIVT